MSLVSTDTKIMIKSMFLILILKKNKSSHFTCLRSVNSAETRKIVTFYILHHENVFYHNFVDFYYWIGPWRSALRIKIHRIMIHTNEISQFSVETLFYVCVLYLTVGLAQLCLLSVVLSDFMSEVVTNYWLSLNQNRKLIFNIVVPHTH